MPIKILVIALIKNHGSILFRKKPDNSPPYKETWYMFGAEISGDNPDWKTVLLSAVKAQTGIDIAVTNILSWDTEIKPDESGRQTFYVYLDCECEFVSGNPTPGPKIEKLEWIPIMELKNYDIVPPSVKLLKKQGYL